MDNVNFLATQVIEVFAGENAVFDMYELEETHTSTCLLYTSIVRTPIVGWYAWPRKRIMPVIIASVTLCCWEISVVHIPSRIWIFTMRRQW